MTKWLMLRPIPKMEKVIELIVLLMTTFGMLSVSKTVKANDVILCNVLEFYVWC